MKKHKIIVNLKICKSSTSSTALTYMTGSSNCRIVPYVVTKPDGNKILMEMLYTDHKINKQLYFSNTIGMFKRVLNYILNSSEYDYGRLLSEKH